ncbi:MAG: PIN domain-containing protein [Candidatus Eisenbacteria bacterium]|nr:PIN domain-containing protein [Candidatus Eisenbacteria bacterium]
MAFTALFDACVIHPAPVRDLLLELAHREFFRAIWTEEIQREWVESLLRRRPDLSRVRLARTCELMNASVADCLVTGYEHIIPALALPDQNDRHVLAAAIAGRADVIVTFNLKDFPADVLSAYGIEAQNPDEFLVHQFHLSPEAVCDAAKSIRERLRNPARSVAEYLETLQRVGLVRLVDELQEIKEHL